MVPSGGSAPGSAPTDLDLVLARHAPLEVRSELPEPAREELRANGTTSVEAVVAVGDLRLSGLVLREAVSPPLYARFVVGFTEAVRSLAGANRGWFDKFTGDGFVVFWIHAGEHRLPADRVSEFCQSVLPASERLVTNLKRNSRNFPVGVGLALGLDSGPCELVRMGDTLTLVGSPIVGATRMAAGARAGETLANVHLGGLLEREATRLATSGTVLERAVVRTKEYPEGQEAYRLGFPATPSGGSEPTPSAAPP
jgi:class 3 adenylate cyclase